VLGLLESTRIPLVIERPESAGDRRGVPAVILHGRIVRRLVEAARARRRRLSLVAQAPFEVEHQKQDRWCWAAVAVSVGRYYKRSQMAQCELVKKQLNNVSCCGVNASSSACNQPYSLPPPLTVAGVDCLVAPGVADVNDLQNEINNNRPVCLRYQWSEGGGHFAVIEGWAEIPEAWVAVEDPWLWWSELRLADLVNGNYKGPGGAWTDTYFTSAPVPRNRMIMRLARGVRELLPVNLGGAR
jgi:hypothetical protein